MSSWQADLCRSIYFCYYPSRLSLTIPPNPYPKVPAASVVWGHQFTAPAWVSSSQSLFSLGLHMDIHQKKHTQKMEGRDSPLHLEHSRPCLQHCAQFCVLPKKRKTLTKRRNKFQKPEATSTTRALGPG